VDEDPKDRRTVTVESFEPGQKDQGIGVGSARALPDTIRPTLSRARSATAAQRQSPGSIGASADPARSSRGPDAGPIGRRPGHPARLEVFQIDAERNLPSGQGIGARLRNGVVEVRG